MTVHFLRFHLLKALLVKSESVITFQSENQSPLNSLMMRWNTVCSVAECVWDLTRHFYINSKRATYVLSGKGQRRSWCLLYFLYLVEVLVSGMSFDIWTNLPRPGENALYQVAAAKDCHSLFSCLMQSYNPRRWQRKLAFHLTHLVFRAILRSPHWDGDWHAVEFRRFFASRPLRHPPSSSCSTLSRSAGCLR